MKDNVGNSAGNMNNNTGASLTFQFWSDKECTQDLLMRVKDSW